MDEVPSSRYRLGSFATNKRLLDASRELNFKGGSSSIHAEAINYDDPEHGVHAAAPTKLQPGMEHLTQLLFILCTGACAPPRATARCIAAHQVWWSASLQLACRRASPPSSGCETACCSTSCIVASAPSCAPPRHSLHSAHSAWGSPALLPPWYVWVWGPRGMVARGSSGNRYQKQWQ